jgi:hypothetical protein
MKNYMGFKLLIDAFVENNKILMSGEKIDDTIHFTFVGNKIIP